MQISVALVNMPFAAARRPSLALTQLRAATHSALGDDVPVRIAYANHLLAAELGDLYVELSEGPTENTGVGDWIFRAAAFPESLGDEDAYLNRFFFRTDGATRSLVERIRRARAGAAEFIDRVIDEFGLDEVAVVGCTSYFSQSNAVFALARAVKERNEDIIVVMGGANCESPMGEEIVRNVEVIDYAFSGPAFVTFPQFLKHLADGDVAAAAALPGVLPSPARKPEKARPTVPLQACGTGVLGPDRDLDEEVHLDYDDFFDSYARYASPTDPRGTVLFETSRGCWWGERVHCTFCGLNGGSMAYRFMNADLAERHVSDLIRSYGDRSSFFECVDNIMPDSYYLDLLPRLKPPQEISIFYEIKANVDESDVKQLADARVVAIQPGIEALNSDVLGLMKKGTTAFHNLSLLKWCAKYSVFPSWNLLIGFPGESEDVYIRYVEHVLPRLLHLPPPSGVFPVRFDRYSPYFTRAESYGLDLAPADFYEYVFPFPPDSLRNFAYYFVDRNYSAPYARHAAKWISPLRRLVAGWQEGWKDTANPPILRVEQLDGVSALVDRRLTSSRITALDEMDVRLLTVLYEPQKRAGLPDLLGGEATEVDAAVERMHDAGVLFEERSRIMSLLPSIPEDWTREPWFPRPSRRRRLKQMPC